MAITSGFYNAVNHDRLYNAEDFGFAMSLAVKNGIDAEWKDKFEVTPATGLQVSVGEGRAWFSDKWIKNEGAITLGLDPASTNLNRIDAVVIDIQGGDDYREADVIILTGTPASTPVAPSLILSDSDKHWQYALAYVTVRAGAVNILSSDIQDNRGTEATPYIAKMGDFDNQLDLTSSNAVQNKVVTKAIVDLEDNVSAYEENGTSASQAYTTGQYIRRNGQLYKVIANISSGAAFTVGTNIQAVTIGNEITKINNNLSKCSLGSSVVITDYNSVSNYYTCPSDGYIRAYTATSSTSSYVAVYESSSNTVLMRVSGNGSVEGLNSIFVRKGTKIHCYTSVYGNNVIFNPLQ